MPPPDGWVLGGHVEFTYTGTPDSWSIPATIPTGYALQVFVGGAGGSGDGRRYVATFDVNGGAGDLTLMAGDPRLGTAHEVKVGGDSAGRTGGWPNGGDGGEGAGGATDGTGGGGSTNLGDLVVIPGTGGSSGTPTFVGEQPSLVFGWPGGPVTSNARQVGGGLSDDGETGSVNPRDYGTGGNATNSAGGTAKDPLGIVSQPGVDGGPDQGGAGADATTIAASGHDLTEHGPDFDIDWTGHPEADGGPGGGGGGGGIYGGAGGAGAGGSFQWWDPSESAPPDTPLTGLYQAPALLGVSIDDPDRYPGGNRYTLGWGGGGDGAGTGGSDTTHDDPPDTGLLVIEWWYEPAPPIPPDPPGPRRWTLGSIGI